MLRAAPEPFMGESNTHLAAFSDYQRFCQNFLLYANLRRLASDNY